MCSSTAEVEYIRPNLADRFRYSRLPLNGIIINRL